MFKLRCLLFAGCLLVESPVARGQPGKIPQASPTPPEESWKIGGDLRLRYELDTVRPGQLNRERGRLRLRLYATGPLSPEWELGVRVRTGNPHSPFSANQPLFNSLGEKEASGFNLDHAYLLYHPDGRYGFQMGLGKSPKFFGDADPSSSLMWASDYAPAGAWVAYEKEKWWLRAGYFTLREFPRYVGADLLSIEGSYAVDLSPSSSLQLEVGYHAFALDRPVRPFTNRGNAVSTPSSTFLSDFQLLEPRLSYNFHFDELPASVSLYYIHNFGSKAGSEAVSVGATLGESKKEGDWSVFGRYQLVDKDAVFSPVAQDDYPLATNFRGWTAGVSYQLSDFCRLDAWMITAARQMPGGPDQFRYRLDWNFKL